MRDRVATGQRTPVSGGVSMTTMAATTGQHRTSPMAWIMSRMGRNGRAGPTAQAGGPSRRMPGSLAPAPGRVRGAGRPLASPLLAWVPRWVSGRGRLARRR